MEPLIKFDGAKIEVETKAGARKTEKISEIIARFDDAIYCSIAPRQVDLCPTCSDPMFGSVGKTCGV